MTKKTNETIAIIVRLINHQLGWIPLLPDWTPCDANVYYVTGYTETPLLFDPPQFYEGSTTVITVTVPLPLFWNT